MQKIRVKIEGFREDVRSFRAEFLDRCPWEVGNPRRGKWWDHKQWNDFTSQHGESLDSINNQGWFWRNSGFDHGLYYRGFLEVNWLTAGEIPCRTKESKRGSVFVILQGWWDKLAQGELLWQMLLHNICHVCPNMGVWQRYVPPALHCHGQGLFHKIALTLRWECSDWQLWQEPGSQHWSL